MDISKLYTPRGRHYNIDGSSKKEPIVTMTNYGDFVGRHGMWERLRNSTGKRALPPKRIVPKIILPTLRPKSEPTEHPVLHKSRRAKVEAAMERKLQQRQQREEERYEARKTYEFRNFLRWKHALSKGKPVDRLVPQETRKSKKETSSQEEQFPFSYEEYRNYVNVFEQVDADSDGQLTFNDLCQAGTILRGKAFDLLTFRRVDKDRSGLVDFIEVLRMFYPLVHQSVLVRATKKWGTPECRGLAFLAEEHKTWKDRMDEESVKEMISMFHVLTGFQPFLTLPMMKKRMGERLSWDVCDMAAEMFRLADIDGDGQISIQEFGAMMEYAFRKT